MPSSAETGGVTEGRMRKPDALWRVENAEAMIGLGVFRANGDRATHCESKMAA